MSELLKFWNMLGVIHGYENINTQCTARSKYIFLPPKRTILPCMLISAEARRKQNRWHSQIHTSYRVCPVIKWRERGCVTCSAAGLRLRGGGTTHGGCVDCLRGTL